MISIIQRTSFLFSWCFAAMLSLATVVGCKDRAGNKKNDRVINTGSGISPKDALSTFELQPGFKIELVASEPLISDPVDMEIDESGRLYVVEMHGYPLDKSGTGVIKLLSDSNGDGAMDKSTVFADNFVLPNSIMRWKKGLLVTDAPNVIYLEDVDGDGKSDRRDTLLTGFALSNPQHNLNTPLLGMDNWIYLGHEGAVATQTYKKEFGDEGTEVYYPAHPGSPRLPPNASGRSVRFRPDSKLLETTSSNTQFGHTFTEWGDHMLVSNWNHIFQEVIAASYLKRNPSLMVPEATQSLSDHSEAAEVFPITKNPQMQLLTDIGVITSACGLTEYLGAAFPAPYDQATFVCEPVSNLIHADKLKEKGATYVASRILEHSEFLASTDAWSRPVNLYVGPDGALYVVDYYRQIIEHPEWMGEEVVKSGQLYNGHDMGRIYRISTTDAKPAEWTKGLKLGAASSEELVKHLGDPNAWWRMNAQRLLVDRQDKNVVPALEQMAGSASSALARVHAMWTLEGMGGLKVEQISKALKDAEPGLRRNAIKMAEPYLNDPELVKSLLAMKDDGDAKVRYQLLCTLGSVNTSDAFRLRNELLFRDMNDQWVQIAALSGASSQTASLLKVVLDSFRKDVPAHASMVSRLSNMIGTGGTPQAIKELIQRSVDPPAADWQASVLEGLAAGLETKKSASLGGTESSLLVNAFFNNPSSSLRRSSLALLKVVGLRDASGKSMAMAKAIAMVNDAHLPEERRVEAIGFLSLGDPSAYAGTLRNLIVPSQPSSIQIASLKTLSVIPDTMLSHELIRQWPNLTPEVQDEAVNTFAEDTMRIELLLTALEKGIVLPSTIGWRRSVGLMAQSNLRLREKSRRLLTKSEEEGEQINKKYQQALSLTGDPGKGKDVFLQNCYTCHQIRGQMGVAFGPDLGTIHNWSPQAIMANILSPNLSISSGYDLWAVELKNGESVQGIISSETATTIALKNANLAVKTINRSDIKSLKALNMSSMPTGLDKKIDQQQMADLLAFLKQNK